MNQVLRLFIIILLAGFCLGSYAQTAGTAGTPKSAQAVNLAPVDSTFKLNVRGTVYENQSLQPMEGATVKLLDSKGEIVRGKTTAKNGQFVLEGVPSGGYTLKVSFMGYKEQSFTLTLPKKNGNFKVGDVMMREDATIMQEAVVEGKLPEMTVVDDTVVYNADAFSVEEGAMVEELIKKLPGVVDEGDGNYTWNGKSFSQILVDGKEFYGNNRNLILKNMPAEIFEKVKVYDRKSERARISGIDDGEERIVLDLTVKKNRKRGVFGNANAGYGTKERYNGNMNVNRFIGDQKFAITGGGNNTSGNGKTDNQNAGATMNWQNKKLELNGSVNGNFSQSSDESWTNRQNFEMKNAAYSNSHNWSGGNNHNFNFNYRMVWKPDSTWHIQFQPNFSFGGNSNHGNSESASFRDNPYEFTDDPLADYKLLSQDIGVNHQRGSNVNSSNRLNGSVSANVNKRLGKNGRNVSVGINGGFNNNKSESSNFAQTDYYRIRTFDDRDSIYHKTQFNNNTGNSHNVSVHASYNEPLADRTYFQLNYNFNYNFNDNNRDVRSIFDPYNDVLGVNEHNYTSFFDAPYVVLDKQQCSYTTNCYQNHDLRAQINIVRTNYNLTFGGNFQPQKSKVDYHKGRLDTLLTRTVYNFSPVFNFQYRFSRQENLRLQYSGQSGQPDIIQMIPDTLSDANPLNIQIGNARLKPSFSQNASIEYNRSNPEKQRSVNTGVRFQTTQNSTTNRTEYNEDTGGRVSMPVNVNGNWNGSANVNFNTALDSTKHWRFNTNTQTSASNRIGYQYRSKTMTTEKYRTRTYNISERLRLTYRREWVNKWQLEANANASFQYNISRSTNTTASNLDHYSFNYGGSFQLRTPWQMSINSDITQQSRRGYADKAMNTNQLIWGASISQSMLRGRALTLSLRAVDILSQRDDVNRNVSATSRTDTKRQMVRSYVVFSATLRFGKFGGRNRRNSDGENQNREANLTPSELPRGNSSRGERGGAPQGGGGSQRGGGGGGRSGGGFGGGGGRF